MIPSTQSLMLPVLRFHSDGQEKSLSSEEAKSFIAKELNLSEDVFEIYFPQTSKKKNLVIIDRMYWARTYLTNAGFIEFSGTKGYWRITNAGREVLSQNYQKLSIAILKEISPQFREWKSGAENIDEKKSEPNDITPGEQLEESYSILRISLASELLDRLKRVDYYVFEQIVIDLLVKMGYGGLRSDMAQVTQKSADGGIDGVIKEDCLGLDMIYIQAKRWQASVGRPEIQQFCGAMNHKGVIKGVFVTTSSFTKDAKEFAESLSNQRIRLIDGKYLADLMIEYNLGVSVKAVYEIKEVDDNYFDPN